jgi:hypothetical protein
MSKDRANDNEGEIELSDEDRLPWLEAVEEDGNDGGPSVGKLVAWIVIGLVAIGVIVGGLYWLGNRNSAASGNDVIAAEQGDYKQRPENPGGMNLSGEGNTSVAAIEGQQPQGNLNLNNMAEQPARPGQPGQPTGQPGQQAGQPGQPAGQPGQQAGNQGRPGQPQPGQQAGNQGRPGQPQPGQPGRPGQPQQPAPAPSGPSIQLGAFSSPAAANSAWTALAGRFRYLAPLSHNVVPVQAGGRTLHRLRASGPDSANICRRLQAAGEACAVVQ